MKITCRTPRMTKAEREEYERDGSVCLAMAEEIIYTQKEKQIMNNLTKRQAEEIFSVNLKNRKFSLDFTAIDGRCRQYAEISFYDKGNCFGWTEKIPTKDFWNKLTTIGG